MAVTDVTPCNRVKIYSGFGGNCCSYLQGGRAHLKTDGHRRKWEQQVSSQSLTNLDPTTRLPFSKTNLQNLFLLYAKGLV